MSRISLRALTALLAVLALAAVPAVAAAHQASASGKTKKHRKHSTRATKADRNRDGLPDAWEKKFGLSLKVDQSGRDQDHDGLNNKQEFQAGTSPCDKDSDDDGVSDKNEQAGTVASFDTATQTLTINLVAGGTATGKVTADTEFECKVAPATTPTTPTATQASQGSDDGPGHDAGDDSPNTATPPAPGTTTPGPSNSDDEGGDHQGDNGDHHGDHGSQVPCGVAQLTAGTIVREAEIKVTQDGPVIHEIKLVLPAPAAPTPTT